MPQDTAGISKFTMSKVKACSVLCTVQNLLLSFAGVRPVVYVDNCYTSLRLVQTWQRIGFEVVWNKKKIPVAKKR